VSAPAWLSRATLSLRGDLHALPRGSSEEYLIHQAVADLFGDRPQGDRGYLYRVMERQRNERKILVLSHAEPLPLERIAFRPWLGVTALQTKRFDPALRAGQALDFQVRVNATRVVTSEDEKTESGEPKKRRFDVYDAARHRNTPPSHSPADVYREWLGRQLAGAAEVRDVGLVERGEAKPSRGMDRTDARTRRIQFVYAELIGALLVEDPRRLLDIAVGGVGRARAFGCGLLLLWPPGSLPRRRLRESE
jgi:CRISPR system Cascade subunit CasE